MKRCSVNSSDLARARELSFILARDALSPAGPKSLRPAEEGPEPVTPQPPPAAVVATSPVPEVDLHAPPLEFESWEVFLAWSLELCRARGAFVVDPQGFVVATRGNVPVNHFEGLGAELAYAMEQLNRIDADAGSLVTIELQFASRRLLGIRVDLKEGAGFVIGFVGARPLGDEVRKAIVRQLAHSLQRLA